MPVSTFNQKNFHSICNKLAAKDIDLNRIIEQYNYPPLWSREPTFSTLIYIILEQQVSLASAKAAFVKLQEKIGHITPKKISIMTDEEMKACYFSRQKIIYARHLSSAIASGELSVEKLNMLDDEAIRIILKKIKGIGDWTVDVYLMMALHRCNCFPHADTALIKSMKEVKKLPSETSKEEIILFAEKWKPYKTIGAFLLWHSYLCKRNFKS